eukprot:GFYU01001353.1.p1 GENE.GFYU01001353.1~~GFYU01001353.1.p1  ORF type:complete len:454 (-),score=52.37 GFYU01001353.1:135-1496(-)
MSTMQAQQPTHTSRVQDAPPILSPSRLRRRSTQSPSGQGRGSPLSTSIRGTSDSGSDMGSPIMSPRRLRKNTLMGAQSGGSRGNLLMGPSPLHTALHAPDPVTTVEGSNLGSPILTPSRLRRNQHPRQHSRLYVQIRNHSDSEDSAPATPILAATNLRRPSSLASNLAQTEFSLDDDTNTNLSGVRAADNTGMGSPVLTPSRLRKNTISAGQTHLHHAFAPPQAPSDLGSPLLSPRRLHKTDFRSHQQPHSKLAIVQPADAYDSDSSAGVEAEVKATTSPRATISAPAAKSPALEPILTPSRLRKSRFQMPSRSRLSTSIHAIDDKDQTTPGSPILSPSRLRKYSGLPKEPSALSHSFHGTDPSDAALPAPILSPSNLRSSKFAPEHSGLSFSAHPPVSSPEASPISSPSRLRKNRVHPVHSHLNEVAGDSDFDSDYMDEDDPLVKAATENAN